MEKLIKLKELMSTEGVSLAVAESVSCGNLQAMIGRVSGASTFFKGGITAYNLGQKVKHLGVEELHADSKNCVSSQVAMEMAKGVSLLFGSTISIATTGYAEHDEIIPMAYIALYDSRKADQEQAVKVEKKVDRISMQQHVALSALEALYCYLGIY
jgi:nicotinamide-nucleotide amidase